MPGNGHGRIGVRSAAARFAMAVSLAGLVATAACHGSDSPAGYLGSWQVIGSDMPAFHVRADGSLLTPWEAAFFKLGRTGP